MKEKEGQMYQNVELYEDIEEIINSVDLEAGGDGSEMAVEELAFLCGLLKKKKPEKILEVGVSAGGTTAVVLKCMEKLGLDAQMISIDIEENYYRDVRKKVGYLVEINREHLAAYHQHQLFCGGGVETFIEEVAAERDIDFCILDTTHRLPGETLTFLVCYPYLKQGAVVVTHDLVENFIGMPYAHGSKILFDTVVAKKYLMWDQYRPLGYLSKYPNIGAFEIAPETGKNLFNVLSALTLKWEYLPSDSELQAVKEIFYKNYDIEFCRMFDEVVNLQKRLSAARFVQEHIGEAGFLDFLEKWGSSKKTVLYGAGFYCRKYLEFANAFQLEVDVIVVSDDEYIRDVSFTEISVCHFSELENPEEYHFIVCIKERREKENVTDFLTARNCKVIR